MIASATCIHCGSLRRMHESSPVRPTARL